MSFCPSRKRLLTHNFFLCVCEWVIVDLCLYTCVWKDPWRFQDVIYDNFKRPVSPVTATYTCDREHVNVIHVLWYESLFLNQTLYICTYKMSTKDLKESLTTLFLYFPVLCQKVKFPLFFLSFFFVEIQNLHYFKV